MKLGTTCYFLFLGLVLGDELRGSNTRQKTGGLQAPQVQKEAADKSTAAQEVPTVSMQAANSRAFAQTYCFHIDCFIPIEQYTDTEDKAGIEGDGLSPAGQS